MLFKTACGFISSLLSLTLLASTAYPAGNVITKARASIQATARVESSLGLTEATTIDQSVNPLPDPGDHLYWLYHPCPDGVKIMIEGDTRSSDPECLRRYDLASLIRLTEGEKTGSVTVTVVFTDN